MTPDRVTTDKPRGSDVDGRPSPSNDQDLAKIRAIEQEVRAETDRLLLVRTRIMLAMVSAGVASGLATDIYLGRNLEHPGRQTMQLLGISAFLGLIIAMPRLQHRVSMRWIAFLAACAPCFLLLIFSIDAISKTEAMNVPGYLVIILGTAILLPWGIWAQVALTGVVGLSILSGVWIDEQGRLPDPSELPAIIVAIGLSYFVALVLESNRLAFARQRHELAMEREIAEQRRLRAEALAQDLDAYAHTVAHDLKNPLHVIAGYSGLLDLEKHKLSAEGQELVDATAKGCGKMARIIDELLLLASVRKAASVASEPLDMAEIIRETRKRLALRIDESQAEIVVPGEWPRAVGHAPWVEEVWANYITNAIKYGGSPPRVELGADPHGDGKIHFWVRDNGQGLDEVQLSKLFEEFSRVAPPTAEGYGLGLSIVKRIVERLGGEVKVTSIRGKGSTFGFTLPT